MSIKKYKTSKNRGKRTVILAIWLKKTPLKISTNRCKLQINLKTSAPYYSSVSILMCASFYYGGGLVVSESSPADHLSTVI